MIMTDLHQSLVAQQGHLLSFTKCVLQLGTCDGENAFFTAVTIVAHCVI